LRELWLLQKALLFEGAVSKRLRVLAAIVIIAAHTLIRLKAPALSMRKLLISISYCKKLSSVRELSRRD
jgi:hypothetical protein